MYVVRRTIEIDAGHRVPFHDSRCRHLHGHRYKIIASVSALSLVSPSTNAPDSGMIIDFGAIKRVMMEHIHAKFDHCFMLWELDPLVMARHPEDRLVSYLDRRVALLGNSIVPVPCIPTAEELAKYWAGLIAGPLHTALNTTIKGARLTSVEVWETPNCTATYLIPAE
ncbi:hypothetical protein LCGC14_0446920 [marine sediment metagenome]|uniref:6-pyruvoyl tetrahydrobiopterin synthase n=1 Tax=marine sediment metagenome TaxID=412755 RepID=A0A0F9V5V7_9ZZZZ